METLTASSNVLKKADASAAQWAITPGKRYAFQFAAPAAPAAGTITPGQTIKAGQDPVQFPDGAAQDITGLTYNLTTFAGHVSGGFEFVATGSVFHLESAGVTNAYELHVSLVELP